LEGIWENRLLFNNLGNIMEYSEEDDYYEYEPDLQIDDLRFVLTCSACPEQYDVFLDGKQIGYIRLRWGHLRADYPDCGGRSVYSSEIGDGEWTGCFTDEKERIFHLTKIAEILNKAHVKRCAEVQGGHC